MKLLSGLFWLLKHPNTKNHFLTLIKVCWWKVNQLLFKFPVLVKLTPKIKLICPANNDYASMIVYTTWPEFEQMHYLLKSLKTNSIFIDIGAGIGEHVILAASKIKTGKIIAFEPDDEARSYLTQSIQLNNLKSLVQVEKLVVAQKNGRIGFDNNQTSELRKISIAKRSPKLLAISLDSYCQKNKIKQIELLKIDVEGAEFLVLSGAKQLLSQQKIQRLIVELNPKCQTLGLTIKQTLQLLQQFNYQLFDEQQRKISNISTYLFNHQLTSTIFAQAK